MKLIHFILGQIILLVDWLTSPRSPKRSSEEQAAIDARLAGLTLYHYKACPFCVKVRRAMKRIGAPIQTLDAKRDPGAAEQLVAGGGKLKVPCLRIETTDGGVEWLYESDAIVAHINGKLA